MECKLSYNKCIQNIHRNVVASYFHRVYFFTEFIKPALNLSLENYIKNTYHLLKKIKPTSTNCDKSVLNITTILNSFSVTLKKKSDSNKISKKETSLVLNININLLHLRIK